MRHLLIVGLVVLVAGACRRSETSLATLVEHDGTVESQRADPAGPWTAAARGERYQLGDAVRTGPSASARLRLARGGMLDLDPETVVRFQRSAGRGLDLGVEAGAVEIEAADAELVLETQAGEARISGRGRARVTARGGQTRLELVAGTIVIESIAGARTFTAGQRIEIDMGGVIIEEGASPNDAGVPPLAIDAGEPPASATEDEHPGPAQVDVVIEAGESATLHDPQPPTAIGVKIGCPGLGRLEITKGSDWKRATVTTGHHGISGWLDSGSHRYRVRCGDEVDASGKLVVRRDAAAKELPARPPRTVVDADGRRYTVLYQNRLPELVVRWPDAPAAPGYVLHVMSGGKERTFEVKGARHTFASGALGEGTHRLWFVAGGDRSAETTVAIDFDNAAAAVYLRHVEVAGGRVQVDGAALPDARVSLEKDVVRLDEQQRFSASGPITSGRRTLALRIAMPSSGVHYYVLRAKP